MITFTQKGDFSKTLGFLERAKEMFKVSDLDRYGEMGVAALQSATPKDSGETANSWYYEIERTNSGAQIVWGNSNIQNGVNIAVILQYGHATRNGGFVRGVDYVNPAIKPIFEKIANDAWKEVTRR